MIKANKKTEEIKEGIVDGIVYGLVGGIVYGLVLGLGLGLGLTPGLSLGLGLCLGLCMRGKKYVNVRNIMKSELIKDKLILDAACGGRLFWFNKHHPKTLYIDNRRAEIGHIQHLNNTHCVKPDILMDFRHMDLPDKYFVLVVWDPPHLKSLQATSIMAKKYGCLNKETWEYDLRTGFNECWRVLQEPGILIFKWNEGQIPLKKVLKLFHTEPLFGHPMRSKTKTHWLCFMKFPENEISPLKAPHNKDQEKHENKG